MKLYSNVYDRHCTYCINKLDLIQSSLAESPCHNESIRTKKEMHQFASLIYNYEITKKCYICIINCNIKFSVTPVFPNLETVHCGHLFGVFNKTYILLYHLGCSTDSIMGFLSVYSCNTDYSPLFYRWEYEIHILLKWNKNYGSYFSYK